MDSLKTFEKYPLSLIIGSNILQVLIYLIGAYIIFKIGYIWLILYLIFIAILEIRLLKSSCIHCYYYDNWCAFGKGKLSSIIFKKGSPKKFINKQIDFIDIIPDFLVSIVPLIVGIILLILNFNWFLLLLIVILLVLAFPVNGFLRGNLACKFCKQRELGCPAEQLFKKKKTHLHNKDF